MTIEQNKEYLGKYCTIDIFENVSRLDVLSLIKGPMWVSLQHATAGEKIIKGIIIDAPLKGRFWSILWNGSLIDIFKGEASQKPYGITIDEI